MLHRYANAVAARAAILVVLLVAALAIAPPAAAQDTPDSPTTGTAAPAQTPLNGDDASPASDDPTVVDDTRSPRFAAVDPETLPTGGLNEVLNSILSPINSAMFKVLFYDISFGYFVQPVTDESRNPVYERVPETVNLDRAARVWAMSEDGELLYDESGENPLTWQAPAGTVVKVVNADRDGLAMVNGPPRTRGARVPFLVIWLGIGAVYFTLVHGFINVRGFGHAIHIVSGKADLDHPAPNEQGDISPFRALTAALSATVGLGNIAGVAIAMVLGGPGALFWMMFLGLFGMTSKFHETTLAQMYRVRNIDGTYSGGPMFYLDRGLREIHPALIIIGKPLAILFAIFAMGAALGGGNMFQANQAFEGFFSTFVQANVDPDVAEGLRLPTSIGFGIVMAVVVAVVVLGGITRIGAATSKIVPLMAVIYVAACLTIIGFNYTALPELVLQVFSDAFATDSAFGGLVGAMIVGFQRAAFSSEAGLGSSAMAHAAAITNEPVREGLVASLEPFIDTIIICFMTGMVVLITGAYLQPELQSSGAAVTLYAFSQSTLLWWFPYILSICIILFAFSTMISWAYYGERAWGYLFGLQSVVVFRIVFVGCVFLGAVASLGPVIDFSDALLLSMALPNILGGIILTPKVSKRLWAYWRHIHEDAPPPPKVGDIDGTEAGVLDARPLSGPDGPHAG